MSGVLQIRGKGQWKQGISRAARLVQPQAPSRGVLVGEPRFPVALREKRQLAFYFASYADTALGDTRVAGVPGTRLYSGPGFRVHPGPG